MMSIESWLVLSDIFFAAAVIREQVCCRYETVKLMSPFIWAAEEQPGIDHDFRV